MMKKLSPWFLMPAIALLAACATVAPTPDGVTPARSSSQAPPSWPQGQLFSVNRAQSQLRLIVYPEGSMASLGHPHVIGGNVIEGEVMLAEPFQASALRLTIDVADLAVDRPDWRAAEGFEPNVDEKAIEGTRDNLLSADLLNAEAHPRISIESISMTGPRWQPDIQAQVTLAGETRQLTMPVALDIDEDSITATGRFVIRQSDFGLTPFAAAGGALRVSDEVLIRFRIEARSSN